MTPLRASGRAVAGAGAFAAMGGSLLGAALQLQQPVLWPAWAHAGLLLFGVAGLAWLRMPPRWRLAAALVCGAMAGAGLAGCRAAAYAQDALHPALEGRSLRVTGVVAEMPQRNEAGTRFRLDVESARWADPPADPSTAVPPAVPGRLALGWYAEDLDGAVHAGERWRFTVRLKAPHGSRNPHGFDTELWMWEQGLQASGTVRTGARDAAPEPLAATWRHPVERAREAVRDAVFARVPERGQAGVIAALVTGDQGAIDGVGK